jgi:hypothetical protein
MKFGTLWTLVGFYLLSLFLYLFFSFSRVDNDAKFFKEGVTRRRTILFIA